MTDMTAEQALDAVRNVLQRAYNSASPVCCGRAGTECCGSPEPEWSEYDQRIMDDLQPVEQYLSQALTALRVPEGWSGWACQYPGKLPKLYGAREIAELNWHPEEGQKLIFLSEVTAAPAPADALDMETELAAKDWVIGNMELRDREQEAELARLRERVKVLERYNVGLANESHAFRSALDKIQAIADGYVSEGELPVMVVVQTICKQALLKGADQ